MPLLRIIDAWPETARARVQDRALMTLRRAMKREEGTRAANTWSAREAALKSFGQFAAARSYDILPASPDVVPEYLKYLRAHGRKLATIEAYAAHLREIHLLAGFKDDTNPLNDRQLLAVLEKLRRDNTEAQKQDLPIRLTGDDSEGELVLFERLMAARYERTDAELALEAQNQPSKTSLTEQRDKMLLAVAMSSGLRREEVAAINWDHLILPRAADMAAGNKNGRTQQAAIEVPRSKTDQYGKGSMRYLSPLAVRLLKAWKADHEPAGYPPFPRVTRHGTLSRSPVGGRTVAEVFKRLTRAAGYDERTAARVSGHSTRIGLAQEMAIDGKELPQIMNDMDWKTAGTVMKYLRNIMVADSGAKETLDRIMG